MNQGWSQEWGGATFPSGTMTSGGNNVAATAGTYDVTFNRVSGQFAFSPTLGVDDIVKSNASLKVYPNPTQNYWVIELEDNSIKDIKIIDLSGKVVLSQKGSSEKIEINAQQLLSGIYIANIDTDKGVINVKLIKK